MSDKDYLDFVTSVKQKIGIDLSQYKEAQMKRRLTSLRTKHGYDTFAAFFEALLRDRNLMQEFLDRITINVSEFFRNPSRWEVLAAKIVPALLQERKRLKIWSAACSTGEEPYSLVMLLTDFLPLSEIRVFATDIDERAIARAQEGVYGPRALQDCPRKYVQRFFTLENGLYRIAEEIKRCVVFRRHDLLTEPFDTNYDLIVCRNVMIYFTEEAKDNLYRKFSRALRPGGVLFVGSTEQIFHCAKYELDTLDTFFYQKRR
ncbi:protein-glutamate O-methyltransferase CheR [Bacillaceae bacterium]